MTNREKYGNKIIDIILEHTHPAVVDGEPISCTSMNDCDGCLFRRSESCGMMFREWLDADVGEEIRELTGRLEEAVGGGDLAGILDQAYITCVSAVISRGDSVGDSERDMHTLYGIYMMFREARKRTEGKPGEETT